jgi:hypothetical protein
LTWPVYELAHLSVTRRISMAPNEDSTSEDSSPDAGLTPAEQDALRLVGEIDQAAFDAFSAEFRDESDRAAVILGAAKLDALLRLMLDRFFLPDPSEKKRYGLLGNGGDEPVSSFSAKIKMAVRLGLIDEEFAASLDVVRKIRNGFAHKLEARSLADSPYREWVKELTWPIPSPTFWKDLIARSGKVEGPSAEFRAVVVVLAHILEGAINLVTTVQPNPLLPTRGTTRWRGGRGRPEEPKPTSTRSAK